MNPVVGESLNMALGDQISVASTSSESVVPSAVLNACGMGVVTGSSAAPQLSAGSGIADLVAKPKPFGLG